jgi:hypothetical protein
MDFHWEVNGRMSPSQLPRIKPSLETGMPSAFSIAVWSRLLLNSHYPI